VCSIQSHIIREMTDTYDHDESPGMGSPLYSPSSPTAEYVDMTHHFRDHSIGEQAPMDQSVEHDAEPSTEYKHMLPKRERMNPVAQRRNFSDDRSNIRKGDSYRRSNRNRDRETSTRRSQEIVDALKKEHGSVSEHRLSRWFPNTDISRALVKCRNVRFSRDKLGGRRWVYETDRDVQKDVFNAVSDGLSSLDSIQRRVGRRFAIVRHALSAMEKSNRLVRSESESGELVWHLSSSE
jgi:hypothetical protein